MMTRFHSISSIVARGGAILLCALVGRDQAQAGDEVRHLHSRLELLTDDYLIERMEGVTRKLHVPERKGPVMTFDRPWERAGCFHFKLFQDGEIYRMYYRASGPRSGTADAGVPNFGNGEVNCYAESEDGIHWTRPELSLFEGFKLDHYDARPLHIYAPNNIVWPGQGQPEPFTHNFSPYKDTHPDCPPEARYKVVGRTYDWEGWASAEAGLLNFQASDGIHWMQVTNQPVAVAPRLAGQITRFWDAHRGRYVEFAWGGARDGHRQMGTRTSADDLQWPDELRWFDWGDSPIEHLYACPVLAYDRAPHIFLGFANRRIPGHVWIEERPGFEAGDVVLATSRDGVHWQSMEETWIRPGDDSIPGNVNPAWGLLQTGDEELSVYWTEDYGETDAVTRLLRGTLRVDRLASLHAGRNGGEFITRPLTFEGDRLVINFSTSGPGRIRVEIQDPEGHAVPGFSLADSSAIQGDAVEEAVQWSGGAELGALAGRVVRLRFVLQDADLYALRFLPNEADALNHSSGKR